MLCCLFLGLDSDSFNQPAFRRNVIKFSRAEKVYFPVWPVGTGVTESRKEVTAEIKCQLEMVSHPCVLRILLCQAGLLFKCLFNLRQWMTVLAEPYSRVNLGFFYASGFQHYGIPSTFHGFSTTCRWDLLPSRNPVIKEGGKSAPAVVDWSYLGNKYKKLIFRLEKPRAQHLRNSGWPLPREGSHSSDAFPAPGTVSSVWHFQLSSASQVGGFWVLGQRDAPGTKTLFHTWTSWTMKHLRLTLSSALKLHTWTGIGKQSQQRKRVSCIGFSVNLRQTVHWLQNQSTLGSFCLGNMFTGRLAMGQLSV